jgi:hypothetical protein
MPSESSRVSLGLKNNADKVECLLFFKPPAHQLKPYWSFTKRKAETCAREMSIEIMALFRRTLT